MGVVAIRILLPGLFLAVVSSIGPCLVRAKEGVPVTVLVLPADAFSEKAAAVLNHLARENFKRSPEFSLIDLREFLQEGQDDPRLADMEKGREHLKVGKEQYDNLELDAAIDELARAVERVTKSVGFPGGEEAYVEALLYLGAAYVLSGDNERGMECFRKVALFDKRRDLDPKVFPPSMIEFFKQAREDVTASPAGTVMIKSSPSAAEVYLNGLFRGITPVSLERVQEGRHFIRVERDGYLPWGQLVEFSASREGTAEAVLKEATQFAKFSAESNRAVVALDDDPPKAAAIQLGEWLRVERLILAVARQRGNEVMVETALLQIHPPKRLAHRRASMNLTETNFISRADAFFSSLYSRVAMPPAEGEEVKSDTLSIPAAGCHSDSDCGTGEMCNAASGTCIPYAPPGDRFYQKWWFWTMIGGGLAVIGGGTLLVWYLLQPDVGTIEFTF